MSAPAACSGVGDLPAPPPAAPFLPGSRVKAAPLPPVQRLDGAPPLPPTAPFLPGSRVKAAPPPPAEEVWNRTLSCILITSCASTNIGLIKTLALVSGVAAIPQCANGVVVRFEVLVCTESGVFCCGSIY